MNVYTISLKYFNWCVFSHCSLCSTCDRRIRYNAGISGCKWRGAGIMIFKLWIYQYHFVLYNRLHWCRHCFGESVSKHIHNYPKQNYRSLFSTIITYSIHVLNLVVPLSHAGISKCISELKNNKPHRSANYTLKLHIKHTCDLLVTDYIYQTLEYCF